MFTNPKIQPEIDLSAHGPHRRDVTHILSKAKLFFLIFILMKSFHFRKLHKGKIFFSYKSLFFECYATMPMLTFRPKATGGYI